MPLLGAAKSRAVLSTGYTPSIADNTKPAALRILTNGTGQWGDSVCNKEPAQCRRASWRIKSWVSWEQRFTLGRGPIPQLGFLLHR